MYRIVGPFYIYLAFCKCLASSLLDDIMGLNKYLSSVMVALKTQTL